MSNAEIKNSSHPYNPKAATAVLGNKCSIPITPDRYLETCLKWKTLKDEKNDSKNQKF